MATRTDVATRALERLGVIRMGGTIPGNLFASVDAALSDMLLELHEEVSLDFDPTAASLIPDERMPALCNLLRYSAHLDVLDTRQDPATRRVLYEAEKKRFFAAVIGDSDFLSPEPVDF